MCNLRVALTCGGGFLSALSEISFTLMRPVLSAGKRTRVGYVLTPARVMWASTKGATP
jgi:hypothetical protein